ncbi:MAG: PIG-L deacetylase family protein [Candidatus Helarchaeota archaeon]
MKEIVLAISAHPDDIEFFAGGTILQFSRAGKDVYFLITTNGCRGSLDPQTDLEELVTTRKGEARAAAEILGVKDVFFLDYEDGFLDRVPHLELRERYIYYLRKLKPNIVLTFDPWNPYEPHSDHRKTALAAFESCYFCHYPLFHPEQNLAKHFVSEVWLFRSPTPNNWVSLTSKDLRVKIKALLKHRSQMQMLVQEVLEQLQAASVDTSILEQMDIKTLVDIFVRQEAENVGKEGKQKYAEAFKVFKLGYVEDVKKILQSL